MVKDKDDYEIKLERKKKNGFCFFFILGFFKKNGFERGGG